MEYNAVKDSGARREFNTGSRRDRSVGKGRCDLLPPHCLIRLSKHYENGAAKYHPHNWVLGQPSSVYTDSLIRHALNYNEGKRDEDHLSAIVFNAFGIMHNEIMAERGSEHFTQLDDMLDFTKPDKLLDALRQRMKDADAAKEPATQDDPADKASISALFDKVFLPDTAPDVNERLMPPAIYVAGPMRGIENYNFPAFDAAREHLLDLGWEVHSPADMDRAVGFDGTTEVPKGFINQALIRDINAICDDCHAIYMLRGWDKSTLAPVEKVIAEAVGLDVYYQLGAKRDIQPKGQ